MRRTSTILLGAIITLLAMMPAAVSCHSLLMDESSKGTLRIRFQNSLDAETKTSSLPDTNDFMVSVTDAKGNVIYNGKYGAAPESILTKAGTYTVTALSREFSTPLFDAPQYGDTEVAVVKAGETTNVTMYCSQLNSGVKLSISQDFLTAYPDGVLYLKSSDGKLMYSYSEKRIAYFRPGSISLILNRTSGESTLLTRTLKAGDMLSVGIKVSSSDGTPDLTGGIFIQIDTTRNWLSENYVIGGNENGGSEKKNAYSVTAARTAAPEEDVWVYGYIVGGDLSSSRCSFEAPFASKTNIVLAAKSNCTDKDLCLSVQLAKGDIRDALNLVDNEDLLGQQVYLKGDLVEAYYGIPGLQSISEYEFK